MEISDSSWSEIRDNNNLSPPDGFQDGEPAGNVKLTFREIMAAIKRNWNWSRPISSLSLFGSPSLYRLRATTTPAAYVNAMTYGGIASADVPGTALVSIMSLSYKVPYMPTKTGVVHAFGLVWAKAACAVKFYYDPTLVLASITGGFVLYSQPPYECVVEEFECPVTTESGLVTAGTAKFTLRMPYAMTLNQIKASLAIAQTSGNALTVAAAGLTLAFVNGSKTADSGELVIGGTPQPVQVGDDVQFTVDVTQIGDGTAAGLKVYLIGYQN